MNKKPGIQTRREFVKRAGVLSFLPAISAIAPYRMRGAFHPRNGVVRYGLFFDTEDVEAIRDTYFNEAMFAELRQSLDEFDRESEFEFLEADVRYNDHLIDLNRIGRASPDMAFHYLMTGSEESARLAVAGIEAIMKFPTWDYFLEDGQHVIGLQRAPSSAVAVALCSDWLGDYIGADTRKHWIEVMGERGCEPCFLSTYGMRYPNRVEGWTMDETSGYFEHRPGQIFDLSNWPHILDRTNLKAVPASALAISAAAYETELGRSEKTDRWLEQASFSITSFGDIYANDGSYDENLSYANYTSEHLAQGMEILARLRGINLHDEINWTGFVDFFHGMSMATDAEPYGIVNFGDAGNGMMSSVPLWIAGTFFDRRSAWFARNLARGHNMWSVIWHNRLEGTRPTSLPTLYRSELDWITARTGYAADDLVVAMRSGGPANHEHADRNGIVLKCFGEVLVADPYRPPYSNTDPSWPLRLSTGHSTLTIDGAGHQYHDGREGTNPSDANARIVRVVEYESVMAWTSDATPAYSLVNPDVHSVTRTILVLHRVPAVIVLDKVVKSAESSIIGARYFAANRDGNADVAASGTRFTIDRPGARVQGYGTSRDGVTAAPGLLAIPEERSKRHPYAEIATGQRSLSPLLITVLCPERPGAASTTVRFVDIDDDVTGIVVGSTRVEITDRGPIPEFKVVA